MKKYLNWKSSWFKNNSQYSKEVMIYEMIKSMTNLNFRLICIHDVYLSIDNWNIFSFKSLILNLFFLMPLKIEMSFQGKKISIYKRYLFCYQILEYQWTFWHGPNPNYLDESEDDKEHRTSTSSKHSFAFNSFRWVSSRAATLSHLCLETGTITMPRG